MTQDTLFQDTPAISNLVSCMGYVSIPQTYLRQFTPIVNHLGSLPAVYYRLVCPRGVCVFV